MSASNNLKKLLVSIIFIINQTLLFTSRSSSSFSSTHVMFAQVSSVCCRLFLSPLVDCWFVGRLLCAVHCTHFHLGINAPHKFNHIADTFAEFYHHIHTHTALLYSICNSFLLYCTKQTCRSQQNVSQGNRASLPTPCALKLCSTFTIAIHFPR